MPPGGADGRAPPARHARRAAPPRAGARRTPARPSRRSPRRDDLDDEARAAVRLATRDRDRALRVPESLVRELSEACSRCVSAWVEARAGRRLRRLRRPPRARWSSSSGARRRRSASATSPTTRCSTSSSRAPAPPTWSRCSPTCAPGSPRWWPGRRRPGRWSCRRASGTRTARWRIAHEIAAPGGLRRVGGRHRAVGPPVHRLAATAATCASPPASMPDEPDRQHQRRAARAGPRPLRAGLPGRGRPHAASTTPPRSAPTSRSRASGRTRSATRGRSGSASSPPMRRHLPRGDDRASTPPCCTAPPGWCGPR